LFKNFNEARQQADEAYAEQERLREEDEESHHLMEEALCKILKNSSRIKMY